MRTALKDVLDAFAHGDVVKAHDVWERDEEIDQVYTGLFRELLTYMMEDPRTITACTHLLFMAKNIERAGDHVTNIAELVSFRIDRPRLRRGPAEGQRGDLRARRAPRRERGRHQPLAPRRADLVDEAARADRRGRDGAGRAAALQSRTVGLQGRRRL